MEDSSLRGASNVNTRQAIIPNILSICLCVCVGRLDLVDIPSQKVSTYRMKKECCEGDTKCKQGEGG